MIAPPVSATPVVSDTIAVGDSPTGVAFTPDGTRAYVTNNLGDSISAINITTNSVIGSPIAVIGRAALRDIARHEPLSLDMLA